MKKYIVNNEIMALFAVNGGTKILLKDNVLITNKLPTQIIEEVCLYYGSSLQGRVKGTKELIGISYKCPIIISEYLGLIAFPTSSYKKEYCSWIFLPFVDKYFIDSNQNLNILFKNGTNYQIKMSIGSFDKQILRASRLLNVINTRKS